MEPALIVAIVVGVFSIGQFFYSRIQAQSSTIQADANRQQASIAERTLRLQEQQLWREEIDARYSYEISMLRSESASYKEAADRVRNMNEEQKYYLNEARKELAQVRDELSDTREELRIARQEYAELLREVNNTRRKASQ